jgi:glutamate transport system permease protein
VEVVWDNRSDVALAFGYTLALFVVAGVLSLLLGTLLAALRVGPVAVLARATGVWVTAVRNTPLLIILIFFRIAGPKVGIQFNWIDLTIGDFRINNIFAACVAGLTVYTSAFVCEAIRAGINAVPVGQAEAARAIGLSFGGVMREIVLPQAVRASLPPLASVQIALLKNTTVAGAVGVFEAFARMRDLTNDFATERVAIFVTFALIFVVLVSVVSFATHRLERNWKVAR